jgi:hypothetical protein
MGQPNKKNAQGDSLPATGAAAEVPGLDAAITAALVTKGVVAKAASVSIRTIESWVKARRIPVVRLGKRCVRFHLPSVLSALKRSTVEAVR